MEARSDSGTSSLNATDTLAIAGGLSHQIYNPGLEDAELIISYSAVEKQDERD